MERNDALERLRQEQKLGEIKSILAVITSSMVLPLYFLFWLCDIIYAPELKWEFLALRATIIPLALVINYLILRANTLSAAYKVGFAYTSLIGLPISIMVLLLENPATPYYAGLNLVAIGTLTFIPWTRNLFILRDIHIHALLLHCFMVFTGGCRLSGHCCEFVFHSQYRGNQWSSAHVLRAHAVP